MSSAAIEIMCPRCGSPQINAYWNDEHLELSQCICLECNHSGEIKEFEYDVDQA